MLDFCKRVLKRAAEDKAGAFAAQSAYFVLLSAVPFMILLLQLLKLLPVGPPELMELAEMTLPEYVLPYLTRILNDFYSGTAKLVSISAVAMLWACSNAMDSISHGLNTICKAEKKRTWIVSRLWSLLYTLVLILGLAMLLIFMVFWKSIVAVATDLMHLIPFLPDLPELGEFLELSGMFPGAAAKLAEIVNSGVAKLVFIAALTLLFALMFQTLPERKVKFLSQLPGALFASAGWVLASECLTLYVNVFHGFSIYGSLATVTLLLLWLYCCFMVQMLGAVINEEIRAGKKQSEERGETGGAGENDEELPAGKGE